MQLWIHICSLNTLLVFSDMTCIAGIHMFKVPTFIPLVGNSLCVSQSLSFHLKTQTTLKSQKILIFFFQISLKIIFLNFQNKKKIKQNIRISRFSSSDIAERLHNVIETQWQKTLEILTTNDASKDLNKLCSNRIVNDLEKCEKNKCSGS